jgi:penicillin amidase
MKRWIVRVCAAVGLVLAVAGGAALLWLRTSLPDADRTVPVNGPEAPVEVLRDRHWVPHIFAESYADAAFALGYVHAEDRLFQMETMRRLGAGRLSEIFGSETLATDRYLRTLGLYRLAEAETEHLSAEFREVLDAYAAGVNAFLAGRDGALPPEFVVLGLQPEPWRIADSLVWGRLMSWRLSQNRHTELLRARLAGRLPPTRIDELWPGGDHSPLTGTEPTAAAAPTDWRTLSDTDPLPAGMPRGASNAWVVSGARTASGKPILANDPHLALAIPCAWFLVRIETPELRLTGAGAAGVPVVPFGHNGRIAFGVTSGDGDVEDLFLVSPDPVGAPAITTRRERIAVRGGDELEIVVRETRHGPLITDVLADPLPPAGGFAHQPVFALAAPYLAAGKGSSEAVFRWQMASDWPGFVDALAQFQSTHLNLVYADVEGNIGMAVAGRFPLRGEAGGRWPAAGDRDWQGFVPFAELPRWFNPASGILLTANNRMVPGDFPWYLGEDFDEGYRARRIAEALADDSVHTLDGMSALQLDRTSLMARHLLPALLAALPARERHREIVSMLRAWNHEMDRRHPEPLLFQSWLHALGHAVYADELGDDFERYHDQRAGFLAFVLDRGQVWCDDIATPAREDCGSRLELALDNAAAALTAKFGPEPSAWRWGDVHRLTLRHPLFDRMPLVRRFASPEIETDGGYHTVNRGANRLADRERPFAHVHGAGFRAVYDLADLRRSRFMLTPGQSGNPLSSHYRDTLAAWRDGGWFELGQEREALRRTAAARLVLLPQAESGQ